MALPALTALLLLAGCSDAGKADGAATVAAPEAPVIEQPATNAGRDNRFTANALPMPADLIAADPGAAARRGAYFGDLHVHTSYSFDAFAFGTMATPDDAYRYARGEPIRHPAGFDVQLHQPLDFYAVTDHAMFLGAVKAAADPSTAISRLPHVQGLHNMNAADNMTLESLPQRVKAFGTFLPETLAGVSNGSIDPDMLNGIAREAWADIIRAAQSNYRPGEFTTFIAYEYTTTSDDRGNLHRNVIFRDSDRIPSMPFSRFHSQNPEDLWRWLDDLRGQGIEALAVPHNANGSNGQMFKLEDWAGNPMDDDYAARRLRNEPLVEITQIKGTSETHPALSDNDEWAGFEIMPYRIATTLPSQPSGSYVREALLNGLRLADNGVLNPYRFGFAGASDTHTGAASIEEDNFFSKAGLLDGSAVGRGSVPLTPDTAEIIQSAGRVNIKDVDGRKYVSGAYETWGAAGLTGVWADANTRDAIYGAFRRRETFATSGPRIKARLFAGYDFSADALTRSNWVEQAYQHGIPQGGELPARAGATPSFLAVATRDPNSAPLQRLQIVKGWTVDGEHHEQVYDIACSDGGTVDPTTHRCPDNGATVDVTNCAIAADRGAAELAAVWKDPDYNARHQAFYYVRVLENPTCRWSTWDAIRAGVAPRPDLAATIQERAWTSPIWIQPE
ncbi:MAG: DUF3604 domain-containing protein [Pseudomonadales bacterium]|nr:DUF3604 domain-containing protein [Pseudomonadales bacterium]